MTGGYDLTVTDSIAYTSCPRSRTITDHMQETHLFNEKISTHHQQSVGEKKVLRNVCKFACLSITDYSLLLVNIS